MDLSGAPDSRTTNVRVGMWLFRASETMFFGWLFWSYPLMRAGAAVLSLVAAIIIAGFARFAWRVAARAGRAGDLEPSRRGPR